MRRYERASTLLTSNRPVEDWESCWVIQPQSARCWTAFSITGMFLSAAREVGGPSWARRSNSN